MNKKIQVIVLLTIAAAASVGFGANVPANSDLAAMGDYYYYTTNTEYANHTITGGGTYTLSEDRVWSSLRVNANLSAPVLFNFSGHTLTNMGCDALDSPFVFKNNSTTIISNGTLATVYATNTYLWTRSPNFYQYRRGMTVGADNLTNATLIIANGGEVCVENGASSSVSFKGSDNRVIVENGGKFNSLIGLTGKNNRFVFKKGANFATINKYISRNKEKTVANFPQELWYSGTSNMVEVCDSAILTAAEVTSLTPDSQVNPGAYHCGLSVSSTNFNWTGGGISFGNKKDTKGANAPTRFEMKEGAKYTSSGEFHIGNAGGCAGSIAELDGEGTLWKATKAWAGRVGSAKGASNMVLRVSNGAFFDVSGASFNVGYETNTSHNAIEVLAGGHIATATLGVGRELNWGNSVLVSGEGSTMTNTTLQIGNTVKGGGGEHTVTADNNGSIYVDGYIYVGNRSSGCALIAKNGGRVIVSNQVIIGNTEYKAESCSNRLEACDGGEIYIENYISGYGDNSTIIARNGTISTRQIFVDNSAGAAKLGTNNLVEVSGRYGFIESKSWTSNLKKGCKIRIVVPKDGFADRNEVARAPVKLAGMTADDSTSIELDVSAFTAADSIVRETPILYSGSGLTDALVSRIDCGKDCKIVKSADGKTLTLKKRSGLILLLR